MLTNLRPMSASRIASLPIVFNQLTAFQEVTICIFSNFSEESSNFQFIKVTTHIFLIKLAKLIAKFLV